MYKGGGDTVLFMSNDTLVTIDEKHLETDEKQISADSYRILCYDYKVQCPFSSYGINAIV